MNTLSDAQLAFFADNGYLTIEDVLDEAAIDAVVAEYDAILDRELPRLVASGKLSDLPKGEGFADRYTAAIAELEDMYDLYQHLDISLPLLHEMAPDATLNAGPEVFGKVLRNPAILDIAEDILGPEVTSCPIQHTRIKPPVEALPDAPLDSNVAKTFWHQDEAVTEAGTSTNMLTVWVAITDASPDMGCMVCVPGSHKQGQAPTMHCPGNGMSSAEIFIPDDLIKSDAVAMPVRRGGVVLLDQRTIHGSLDNVSGRLRWSFDLRYVATGQDTGRSIFPSFVARSRAAPQTELQDAETYRSAWIAARDTLALQGGLAFNERWSRYSEHPLCA